MGLSLITVRSLKVCFGTVITPHATDLVRSGPTQRVLNAWNHSSARLHTDPAIALAFSATGIAAADALEELLAVEQCGGMSRSASMRGECLARHSLALPLISIQRMG